MGNQSTKKTRKNGASALGVLLIICMLLIAACTLVVNLAFRNHGIAKLGKKMYYLNESEDMPSVVPKDAFVVLQKADQFAAEDIVLYRATTGSMKISKVSLVLSSTSTAPGITPASVYYLTSETSPDSVAVMGEDIVGVCKQYSGDLGTVVGFLLDKTGIIVGLISPCVILLLYLIALVSAGRDADDEDDDDTDLAFVKSIQEKKKLQQTAEIPRVKQETVKAEKADGEKAEKPVRRHFTDEELAAMEEKEAAERAERIAAIRNRMENRQQTETPDNVPLFTTEIIAKTHTMSIPKNATAAAMANSTAKLAQQKKEEALQKAREAAEQAVPPIEKPAKPVVTEEAEKAAEQAIAEIAKAAEKPAESVKPAAPKKKKKPALKQQAASSSFDDLMAFLNSEEQKLDK